MMRRSTPVLWSVVLPLFAACAAPKAAAPAASATPAQASTPARSIAPFQGELASADGPALEASCTARLASARERILRFKATTRPVPRAEIARVLEIYDEASADID